MSIEAQVRAKSELSTDELLIELGHSVGMFEAPPTDEVAKNEGIRWLDRHIDQFKSVVCVPVVKQVLNQTDSFALSISVGQALANSFGDSGAATVALLLVRRGINRLCGWS